MSEIDDVKEKLRIKRLEQLARGRDTARANRIAQGIDTKTNKEDKKTIKKKEKEVIKKQLELAETEIAVREKKIKKLIDEDEPVTKIDKEEDTPSVKDVKLRRVELKPKKRYIYVPDTDSSSEEEIEVKTKKKSKKVQLSPRGPIEVPKKIESIQYVDNSKEIELVEKRRQQEDMRIKRIRAILPGYNPI